MTRSPAAARSLGTMGDDTSSEGAANFAAWTAAVQDYLTALDAGEATEELQQRVRTAWMPLRYEMAFEPSRFALKLMEDVFNSTH